MTIKTCTNGHTFEKTTSCPVCPICSREEMQEKYGDEFPKLSAPALRALDSIGITKLSQLTKYSEKELLALHGFGPSSLKPLRLALRKNGLTFKI